MRIKCLDENGLVAKTLGSMRKHWRFLRKYFHTEMTAPISHGQYFLNVFKSLFSKTAFFSYRGKCDHLLKLVSFFDGISSLCKIMGFLITKPCIYIMFFVHIHPLPIPSLRYPFLSRNSYSSTSISLKKIYIEILHMRENIWVFFFLSLAYFS